MALDGRTAVVTGAGRGIGAAVARALSDAGAAVLLSARSESGVEAVARALRARGRIARAVMCDVTDPAAVRELGRAASETLERVDILVNNAGVASSAPLQHITLEEWNRVMAINATGTFLCTQAFVPEMVERGFGRVVNVASVAGLAGARYAAAYSASKHAVIGFTRCIAAEVADRGVTINAVCPGFVDTPMTDATLDNVMAKTGLPRDRALEAVLHAAGQSRLVQPEEVARAVLSLCSDEAGAINGQSIPIAP